MKCTHVALQVRDIEKSIAFYARYAGLKVVHDRTDDIRVVWLGWGEDPPRFAFVLLHKPYDQNRQPEWQHIGLAVDSRTEVDAIYQRASADGVPAPWPPKDAGPIVGYYCGLSDPDGNLIEFSFGQRLG